MELPAFRNALNRPCLVLPPQWHALNEGQQDELVPFQQLVVAPHQPYPDQVEHSSLMNSGWLFAGRFEEREVIIGRVNQGYVTGAGRHYPPLVFTRHQGAVLKSLLDGVNGRNRE